MKVFKCPVGFEEPQVDWRNFNRDKMYADEQAHQQRLAEHLRQSGYTGKYTGKIVSFPVADGSAMYMLADGKGKYGASFLVHLGYGDGYHYRGIEHFPKTAIIAEITKGERWAKMFATKFAAK